MGEVKQDGAACRDAKLAELLELFLIKKQQGADFEKTLRNSGFSSAAIYGMGRLGKRLYHEIRPLLRAEIDQNPNAQYGDVELRGPQADTSDLDCIIITATYQTEEIREYLEQTTSCRIITIQELMKSSLIQKTGLCGNRVIGDLNGCKINWLGSNATIHVGSGFKASQLVIDIHSDVELTIGENVVVEGACLWRFYEGVDCSIGNDSHWWQDGSEMIVQENAKVHIGNHAYFYKSNLLVVHRDTFLTIGNDSLFGRDIVIRTGDGHPIYEIESGRQINKSIPRRGVVIGEHVWVGQGAMILYPSVIGNGTVIGARSLIKGSFPNNCMVVGQADKARVIRENIAWKWAEDEIGVYGLPERYRQKTEK